MEKFIPHIGVDESGKGDFFGPLVIAGVLVDEESAAFFAELVRNGLQHESEQNQYPQPIGTAKAD